MWNWFIITTCSALTWKTFTLLVLQVLKSRNCFSSEQKKSLTSVLKSTFFSKWLHLTNMEKMLFCSLPSLRYVSLTRLNVSCKTIVDLLWFCFVTEIQFLKVYSIVCWYNLSILRVLGCETELCLGKKTNKQKPECL